VYWAIPHGRLPRVSLPGIPAFLPEQPKMDVGMDLSNNENRTEEGVVARQKVGHTAKHFLGNLATTSMVLCALVMTAMVVRREYSAESGGGGPPAEFRTIDTPVDVLGSGQRIGPSAAPVTVVVFADFQCPYCADGARSLDVLRERYKDDLSVLYRHLPLSGIHPHAYDAAVAAECAGAQGAFKAFHDLLFTQQTSLGTVPWTHLAERAGVRSNEEFAACLEESWPKDRINHDVSVASQLGIRGTPAILIGGRLFEGLPPTEVLEAEVARMLRKALATGVPDPVVLVLGEATGALDVEA